MSHKKSILFYYPAQLGRTDSGSGLRPLKMLEYFKKKYDVDIISGSRGQRKKLQRKILRKVKGGFKYEFLYFENLSSPHIKAHRVIAGRRLTLISLNEYLFLRSMKKFGIKNFYYFRDVHWLFPELYPSRYSKRFLFGLKILGIIELYLFKNLVDYVVPNERFSNFIAKKFKVSSKPLPPGGELNVFCDAGKKSDVHPMVKFFYVGGCGVLYDPEIFFDGVKKSKTDYIFTYCTRENEFLTYTQDRKIPKKVRVIYKTDDEMRRELASADVAVYLSPPIEYIQMAFSVKISEYIGSGLPILCYKGTYLADVVKKYNIGWCIDCDAQSVAQCLDSISKNPSEIEIKKKNLLKVQDYFLWDNTIKTLESYC